MRFLRPGKGATCLAICIMASSVRFARSVSAVSRSLLFVFGNRSA